MMPRRYLNKRHVLMLRWGVPCLVAAAALGLLAFIGGGWLDPRKTNPDGTIDGLTSVLSRDVDPDATNIRFTDVTDEAGIDFHHFPATRQSLLPEDMGSGIAWGDFNNSGYPDLFLVNFKGNVLSENASAAEKPRHGYARAFGHCALYHNNGDGTFTDVSEPSGAGIALYGIGAAWGDYTNDGFLDLYITAYGPNVLFRNNGDETFTNVTDEAGVGDPSFSAGPAWADYNTNGWLDLYVPNYVEFSYRPSDHSRASRQYGSEIPYTLNPSSYPPAVNRLYRNNADGTFTDVARDAGVDNPTGRSLQAVWFDFDLDGRIDLYVANDISANGVFRNMGDNTFADIGASSLAADYRGAMGMAVADYDRDGDLDLFITHWIAQENALFENQISEGWTDAEGNPRLVFMEVSELLGLGQPSLRTVGWATGFADFDNDGLLDLWVVNGHTLEERDDHTRLRAQPVQLFWQRPGEGFFEIAEHTCESLAQPIVGRGGAHADFDGDGRLDLAIHQHGGRTMLLRNTSDVKGNWITIRLRQRGANTHAVGARVEVHIGDIVQTAQVLAGDSYLSQNHGDLHFGLGDAELIDRITIHWRDGAVETRTNLAVNERLMFTHGPTYR